jgi:hypothetical protein
MVTSEEHAASIVKVGKAINLLDAVFLLSTLFNPENGGVLFLRSFS